MKASTQIVAQTADVGGSNVQTIIVPGCQGTPKGARVIVSSGTTNGTNRANSRMGIGYTDFTTSRAVSAFSQDGSATSNTGGREDTASIICLCAETSNAQDAKATAAAIDGGITLTWSDYPAVAVLIEVTVYFGDVQCNLHDRDGANTVGGTTTKTGLAFAPNALEIVHLNSTVFSADNALTNARVGWGHAVLRADATTIQQCCFVFFDRSSATVVSACASDLRDDSCAHKITVSTAGVLTDGARLDCTSFTSDGYILTTRLVAETINTFVFAIRYGHGDRAIVIPTTTALDTTTTGQQSQTVPSPSYKPLHIDAIGVANPTKNSVNEANVGASFGAVSDARPQGTCQWSIADGVTPTACNAGADVIAVWVNGQGGGLGWQATVDAITATTWVPNVTVASSTKAISAWVLIGFGQQSEGLYLPQRRWRRQLARM